MKKHLFYLLLFVSLLACSSPNKTFENKNDEQSIIDEFERQLKEKTPDDRSISGVIIKRDKIIWSKAFGVSNLETQSYADTSTIYRTGSISKTFTAFLMMLLVQEGTINLNDPVELYLPEISKLKGYADSTKITFQQLASHTSGLIREPELRNAATGPIEEWESKILESIPATSFGFKPGEKFNYSNIGYGILGLALSRAAQKSFLVLVKEKIFIPLDMKSSFFIVPEEKLSNLSAGIQELPLGVVNTSIPQKEHLGRGYKVPNGGIYSTPNDLAKFMLCNANSSLNLLSDDYLDLMQRGDDNLGKNKFYGMGYFIDQENQTTIIHHGGAVAGYTANFAFEKINGYGVILMRNCNRGDLNIMQLPLNLLKALSELKE